MGLSSEEQKRIREQEWERLRARDWYHQNQEERRRNPPQGNTVEKGFAWVFAACIALALAWTVILYVGIPLAAIGLMVAYYIFSQRDREIEIANDKSAKTALLVAGGSLVLGIVSLAGNLFTDDGPLSQPAAPEAVATVEASPAAKVEVSADECADLKKELHTTDSIKAMCSRMYDTDGWGDAAGRVVCENDHRTKLKACGIDIFIP